MPVIARGVPRNLQDALGTNDISKYKVSEAMMAWVEFMNTTTGERLGVRQIADASGMPAHRVHTTLSGRRVPTRSELDMLCMAVGLGKESREALQELRVLEATQRAHQKPSDPTFTADAESARRIPPRQPVPAFGQPDPIRVSTTKELVQALKAVHVWGGTPSLRELERRTKSALRRSTISDMLRGESLPDYDRYVAFLRACGVDGANLDTWVFVWRRLKALESPEAAPWMPGAGMP
ncbi:helix-turn-helix domain-containing protein [Streptomyces tendae]